MVDLICPIISTTREDDDRKVIDHVVAGGRGANMVFILGHTGEFSYISQQSKLEKIHVARQEILRQRQMHNLSPKALSLAVGITGKDMDETIELAQCAETNGADYLVFMPIFPTLKHNGRFSRRCGKQIRSLLEHTSDKPIMFYNNPHVTGGKNIRTDLFKEFAEDPRIVALKDSSGVLERLKNYRRAANENAKVYAGDEILGLRSPGDGIVAGSANILPLGWSRGIRTDWDEDIFSGAVRDELIKIQQVYTENPIGAFHYILEKQGVINFMGPYNQTNSASQDLRNSLDNLMGEERFQTMFKASTG
jgi:dihydrodipicolinate synthase/N-acetylneuraminate lyase